MAADQPRVRGRLRAARSLVALAAAVILSTACGSELSRQELLAANTQAFQAEKTAASPAGAPSGGAQPTGEGLPDASPTGASTPVDAPKPRTAGVPSSPAASAGASGSPTAAANPGRDQPRTTSSSVQAPVAANGAGVAPAPVPAGTKEEIRIGSIGASGGVIGTAMQPVRQGAIAWANDINRRGGLNGHPVRLLLADDQSDPRIALSLVKKMVEEQKVQAFYAIHGVVTEQAYVPYLEQKQVPIVGTSGGAGVDSVASPIIYEVNPGSPDGTAWAHALPALGITDKRKAALVFCREASVCPRMADVLKKGAKAAGFDVVYEGQISMAQPDYTAEMISARNAGADIVFAIGDNSTTVRMARSAHRQGYQPVFSTQWSADEDSFLKLGGEDVEGVVVGGVVPDFANNPKLADYRAAMDRYIPGGGRKGSFSAFTWANGKLFEAIAGGFGPTVTSADIIKGLLSLRQETLGGIVPPITFAPGRGHIDTNQCVYPGKVQGGKFVYPLGERFVCAPGFKAYAG